MRLLSRCNTTPTRRFCVQAGGLGEDPSGIGGRDLTAQIEACTGDVSAKRKPVYRTNEGMTTDFGVDAHPVVRLRVCFLLSMFLCMISAMRGQVGRL